MGAPDPRRPGPWQTRMPRGHIDDRGRLARAADGKSLKRFPGRFLSIVPDHWPGARNRVSDLALSAENASAELSPAELHGTVVGMLCARSRLRFLGLDPLAQTEGDEDELPEYSAVLPVDAYLRLVGADAVTDIDALMAFVELAHEELVADDMRFMPLLPDDDHTMDARVEALAEWCAAFLAGFFALGSLTLSDEERDIVEDFSAISAAEVGDTAGEDEETLFMELLEYVKVTVLLLLEPGGGDEA